MVEFFIRLCDAVHVENLFLVVFTAKKTLTAMEIKPDSCLLIASHRLFSTEDTQEFRDF